MTLKLGIPPLSRGESFRRQGVYFLKADQLSAQAVDEVEVITLWDDNLSLDGRFGKAYIDENSRGRIREGQTVRAVILERKNQWHPSGRTTSYPDNHLWKVLNMKNTELLLERIVKS